MGRWGPTVIRAFNSSWTPCLGAAPSLAALPPYHLVVPSSRACGQKGGCQMGVGVFQPSEMEVVMSEHRFVITDRLWQSIAPLLPGKATDRGATPRPDDPVEENPPSVLAPQRLTAQSTPTGRLPACQDPPPSRTRWPGPRLADPALQRAGALFLVEGEPGWANMKKGAARPPVHTTSGEDQKVRVGRTAMAKASESELLAELLMKSR